MRTNTEMMDLILQTAQGDDRVRAVVMNGSRANPAAPADIFQDYDIVYAVRDLPSFTRDHGWIDVFGPRLMLQMPEAMRGPIGDGRFTYLMLLADGNRIDLTLIPVALFAKLDARESASLLLLDKDGLVAPYPPAGDTSYQVRPPSALEFSSCCNNFWWCAQNVAEGLWRDELPYAMAMLEVLRDELHDVIAWDIGARHGFAVSPGKMGKYFKRYMDPRQYEALLATYPGGSAAAVWDALFAMAGLFRTLARAVGAACGFAYPETDDAGMTEYLNKVRRTPAGAQDF